MRDAGDGVRRFYLTRFPFLFGGTFIEGATGDTVNGGSNDFPSFSEGLSLRGWKS